MATCPQPSNSSHPSEIITQPCSLEEGRKTFGQSDDVSGDSEDLIIQPVQNKVRSSTDDGSSGILVICTGNSCRSQMAEGFLRHFLKESHKVDVEVQSAGIEAHGVNPNAILVMREEGIDISCHRSKTISQLDSLDFDYVITVCNHANEFCPKPPSSKRLKQRIHHDFPDPAKFNGKDCEMRLEEFRSLLEE